MQDTQSREKDVEKDSNKALSCFLIGAQMGDDLNDIAVAVHEFYENEFNKVGTAAEQWLKLLVNRVSGLMDNAKECGVTENIGKRWDDFVDAYRAGDWQGMESAANIMGRTMNRTFSGHIHNFSYGEIRGGF